MVLQCVKMLTLARGGADLAGISLLIEDGVNRPSFVWLGLLTAVVGPGRRIWRSD